MSLKNIGKFLKHLFDSIFRVYEYMYANLSYAKLWKVLKKLLSKGE